jgi:DNA helicase-2/ATP-dependent DNA helicase PcrA
VLAGADPPSPWAAAPRVTIDGATLSDPGAAVELLHRSWAERRPVVIDLRVDAVDLRRPVDHHIEPWRVAPGFEPWLDRLHFLVWANNYDARGGDPVWWWGRKAVEAGASLADTADVTLPDGAPAWIDGGPRTIRPLIDQAVVHAETIDAGRLDPIPTPAPPTAALDPEQLAAVDHDSGPARVIAPAGSGKTRVLTERLRHLIADRGYETGGVLALAYNKQAQLEMASRTAGLGARIQTLNAWGYGLVARIQGTRPEVIEERAMRAIVEGLVPRPARRVNTDPYARYLEGLSLIRLGLRSPEQVEAEFGDVPGLADAFVPYRAELRARGVVDFDEQVYRALESLLGDGTMRRSLQAEHRHLLVDEFQDLTPAHVLLVRLLSCPGYDVFGVGDDDQTIYSHAGADPRFLVDFDDYFPAATHHALEVNYRCPRPVTEAAAHLLGYNTVRVDKVIRSGQAVATAATGLEVRSHPPDQGAAAVARLVSGWQEGGAVSEDVAVLARVQSLLLGPHVALTDAGVPVDSIVDRTVLGRLGVRAALAYLRIATDPERVDPADLVEVQRRPSRGLPQWIDKWLSRCRSIDDVHRAAKRLDDVKVAPKLGKLADDLAELAALASSGATTRTLLSAVRDDIGLGSAMTLLDSTGVAAASHLDDLEGLLQVADLHPDPAQFGAWLAGTLTVERTAGGVTLSTVHRVKGREWPMVAMVGVNGGILPHRLAEGPARFEEERRILHVAITRSATQTVVLFDESRPSAFLSELDGTAPHRQAGVGQDGEVIATPPAKSWAGPSIDASDPVAAALKAWRAERAAADQVPAYVVMWDRHLAGIAARRPTTKRELAGCPGIGPARLETYGDAILDVIRDAVGS